MKVPIYTFPEYGFKSINNFLEKWYKCRLVMV